MTDETINIPIELECGDVVNISIGISLTCNSGGGPAAGSDDLQFTLVTTAADEVVTLGATNVGTFNAVVDWGDGSSSNITTFDDADWAHTFDTAGTYTVTISGDLPSFLSVKNINNVNMREVLSMGNTGLLTCIDMFKFRTKLTSAIRDGADLSAVTNLHGLFEGAGTAGAGLVVDLSGDPLPLCTNANKMADGSEITTVDMTGCVMNALTNISYMFTNSSSMTDAFLGDLFGPDHVGNVDASFAFNNCSALQYTGMEQWDIVDFTNMTSICAGCTLPTSHYNDILVAWAAQAITNVVTPNFGSSTSSGAGTTARDVLVNTYGWTITDGDGVHAPAP